MLFLSTVFLNGCFNKQNELIELKTIKKVQILSDSTFYGDSECLLFADNKIIVAEDSRVLLLDNDLKLLKVIGRPGKGPGEFSKVYFCVTYKDTLYAISEMSLVMNVFLLNGKFVRTFSVPAGARGRIAIDQSGRFYLPTINAANPIICFDNTGKVLDTFGEFYEDGKKGRLKTHLDLHIYNEYLIAFNRNELIIQFFNLKNRKKIKEYYIKISLHDFQNELKHKEKRNRNSTSSSVLVSSDSFIDKNDIYFTIVERTDENEPYINKIVWFNLMGKDKVKYFSINEDIYDRWISSFCVNNKIFIISDAGSSSLLKCTYE